MDFIIYFYMSYGTVKILKHMTF